MKTKLILFLTGWNFLFCFSGIAQQKITPEFLWKLGRVSDPQLSPDGSEALYNVRNYNLASNKGNTDIWKVEVATAAVSKLAGDSSNETMPRWSSDGKKIYYLNDAGGSNQLYCMNTDGTGKIQLTTYDNDINLFGISKSGNMIWFAQDVKLEKPFGKDLYPDLPKATGKVYDDLMMRHWDSWFDGTFSHVFIATFDNGKIGMATDIMKNERYDSPLKPDGGDEEIAWSPDGKTLAYTCKKLYGKEYAISTNSDIYLYDVAKSSTSNFTEGMNGYDKAPAFSPDGTKISWLSMNEPGNESDRNRMFLYDFGTKTKRELTTGYDNDVICFKWNVTGKTIYFISGTNATEQVFSYDLNPKNPNPIKQITNAETDHTALSVTVNAKKEDVVITSMMSISLPTELFSISTTQGYAKQITNTNVDLLSKVKMGKIEKRMIKATDGKDILTWVMYPPDFNPAKKYPTILYCQGGPQSTVSQFFSYRWNFQLMIANGYIIVAPNRRGLPSFGSEWNAEISGDWGGQAMNDLLSAIDSVSKESFVNKDKMGAIGASFGGYSAYWLEGHHNKRFKAFIAHCGVFDLSSQNISTEELWFSKHEFKGFPWDSPVPESYSRFSPSNFVKNWDTPILVIHNEKDFRVPYMQGLEAYTAARMHDIPARFLCFPDEGHWVLKPQNSVMWQRVFYEWLDKYLK
ncbi:MAG: S9 family peptidase [Bacteroidetes bacterium]|nr:S9 family peptidase [Bacteroidota bacterium]